MVEISDDKITGLLMAEVGIIVREFYADEIALVLHSTDEDAPGLDEIIDQVSVGQLGIGGQEITRYKTDLEQAEQGVGRADKYVAHMVAEIERWASEHADFLRGLITGALAEKAFVSDVERVRKLADLLERKQDAFPAILLALYTLGPGWDKVFAEQ